MIIPQQLQNPDFRFVLLGKWNELKAVGDKQISQAKIPFEKDWQNNGYAFNDERLQKHFELKKNYGVIGGYGNLRIIDIDDVELANEMLDLIHTFTVRTGSGGTHFYILSDYETNHVFSNGQGEFRANKYQVVGPNCIHPSGNMYTIIKDIPIATYTKQQVEELIGPLLRQTDIIEVQGDSSRSSQEFKEVIKLIRANKTQDEIYDYMKNFDKWKDAHPKYREYTYRNALKFVVENHLFEPQPLQTQPIANYDMSIPQEIDFQFYSNKELQLAKTQQVDWLVQGLIQKRGIGIFAGKSASYKSSSALHIASAIASGTKVFGRLKTIKSKVLYLNEENQIELFQSLANKIQSGMGELQVDDDLWSATFQNMMLDNPLHLAALEKFIKSHNIEVLVLDSLRRLISFEENDANAINAFYSLLLKPLAKKNNLKKKMIHPSKKDIKHGGGDIRDSLRGSSDLVNICDFLIFFNRKAGQFAFDLITVKTRGRTEMPKQKILVVSDNEDPDKATKIIFENVTEAVAAGDDLELNKTTRNIIAWIKDEQLKEFAREQVIKKFDDIGASTITRALNQMVDELLIRKTTKGRYRVLVEHEVFKDCEFAQEALTGEHQKDITDLKEFI